MFFLFYSVVKLFKYFCTIIVIDYFIIIYVIYGFKWYIGKDSDNEIWYLKEISDKQSERMRGRQYENSKK